MGLHAWLLLEVLSQRGVPENASARPPVVPLVLVSQTAEPPANFTELDSKTPQVLLAGMRSRPSVAVLTPPLAPLPKPRKAPTPPKPEPPPRTEPPPRVLPAPSLQSILNEATLQHPSVTSKASGTKAERREVAESLGQWIPELDLVKLAPSVSEEDAMPKLSQQEARIYRAQLDRFFREHWVAPLHLADSNLVAVVRFWINREGRIQRWEFEKNSRNALYDRSVTRLLNGLQFLPSLPDSYPESAYSFGVRFSPNQSNPISF